jgi:uncharacterized protein
MKILDVQQAIHDITAQLIEKYRPEKIILFGSAASGAGEIKDIDFFIVKNDIPHYGADRILELYRLIKTDVPVDYIVYKPEETENRLALGDPFVKKILIEGKLLYG